MVDHEDKSILPRHCRNCKEVVNIDNEFEMTSQWAILPAPVRYDPDLPANAKLLYAEIAAKTNATGFCWASNDFFARQMKLSADSVSRLIKTLETAEYIVVAVDPAAINEKRREIYLTPKGFGLRGGIGKNADTPSRQKCRDRPGKNAETGIGKNADPNIIENNNNKNNRAERPKYVPLDVFQAMADYAGEDGKLLLALLGWAGMRHRLHKPVSTAETVRRAVRQLDKLSQGDHAYKMGCIRKATDRCWLTFFPLKPGDEGYKDQNRPGEEPQGGPEENGGYELWT